MLRLVKIAILYAGKCFGLFAICRLANRRSVRILCYHGFAAAEEYKFRPKLLIKPSDFEKRMHWLKRKGYRVIALDEAVDGLANNEIPRDSTVITMDDGMVGVHARALPILRRFGYPATAYVSTYYVENQQPMFNLLVQYLFWLTGKEEITLPQGIFDWVQLCQLLRGLPSSERPEVIRQMGEAFGVNVGALDKARIFHLMNSQELQDLDAHGINIQLHTHRHRWTIFDNAANAGELSENIAVLRPLTSRPLVHFCYPAGQFDPAQYDWLMAYGIKSATTLEPGLNRAGDPLMGLRRIIDGSNVTDIEFEAEMCGVMDVLRSLVKAVRTFRRPASGGPVQTAAPETTG